MSTTPDPTREIGDSCCSKCGKLLLVNDSAIVHTDMREGCSLVLGNCCADLVIGSLVQDFAQEISSGTAMGYWINQRLPARMRRLIDASKKMARQYELNLDYEVNYVRKGREK